MHIFLDLKPTYDVFGRGCFHRDKQILVEEVLTLPRSHGYGGNYCGEIYLAE